MSQENIETLREGYAAASRRDWDRCLRFMHPDIEWVTQRTGTYHGHKEVRRSMEETALPFEEVILEPEEFFERGDQVVVFVHFRARLPGTQAVIENRIGHVWTMRDGKAVRCQTFPRRRTPSKPPGCRSSASSFASGARAAALMPPLSDAQKRPSEEGLFRGTTGRRELRPTHADPLSGTNPPG